MDDNVYIIIQTRNVDPSDRIVKVFRLFSEAEKWLLKNCNQFGDGISNLTGNFISFYSYDEYATGQISKLYMYPGKPGLKIVEMPISK